MLKVILLALLVSIVYCQRGGMFSAGLRLQRDGGVPLTGQTPDYNRIPDRIPMPTKWEVPVTPPPSIPTPSPEYKPIKMLEPETPKSFGTVLNGLNLYNIPFIGSGEIHKPLASISTPFTSNPDFRISNILNTGNLNTANLNNIGGLNIGGFNAGILRF
jgi:hypothetical protein